MIIPMPSFKINTRAPYMYDKKLDQNENNAKVIKVYKDRTMFKIESLKNFFLAQIRNRTHT